MIYRLIIFLACICSWTDLQAGMNPEPPQNRWYNVCESIYETQSNLIFSAASLPFMWEGCARAQFITPTGLIIDSVSLSSIYQVLDPYSPSLFNNAHYNGQEMEITLDDYYTLDSVYFFGYYFRNPNKNHVVDTLRISIIRNDDLYYSRYVSDSSMPWIDSLYGVDSLLWVTLFRDTINNIGVDANGNAQYVFDIYLDSNSVNDKTSNGLFNQYFISDLGLPAFKKERFGLSMTYISGDGNFQSGDTIYMKSSQQQDSIIYNFFQPLAFEKSLGSAPLYFPNDFNVSGVSILNRPTELYMPSYNFGPSYAYDYWYIDYYISCVTCNLLSQKNPNPSELKYRIDKSQNQIIVNITSNLSDISSEISLYDLMGRDIPVSNSRNQDYLIIGYPELSESIYFLTIGNQKCLKLALD